jgi:hypothetical protein
MVRVVDTKLGDMGEVREDILPLLGTDSQVPVHMSESARDTRTGEYKRYSWIETRVARFLQQA